MADGVKKKTISMESDLYDAAVARAKALGYESFSAYLQFLMEADTLKKPKHVRSEQGLYMENSRKVENLRLNEPDD